MPADEPLVLANILGFDSDRYISLDHEAGMSTFWREAFSALPPALQSGIPFMPTEKLSSAGVRWAPKTFLQCNRYGSDAFFESRHEARYRAELCPEGLLAQYRGFKIVPRPSVPALCLLSGRTDQHGCIEDLAQVSLELSDSTWIRFQPTELSGQEYADFHRRMHRKLHDGNLAVVLQHPNLKEEPWVTHGLTVDTKGVSSGPMYATTDDHVAVELLREYPTQLHIAARKIALDLLVMIQKGKIAGMTDQDVPLLFDEQVRDVLASDRELRRTIRLNSREDLNAKKSWSFAQILEEFKDKVHHHAHLGFIDLIEYSEWTRWQVF